jgi:hypothetical protein
MLLCGSCLWDRWIGRCDTQRLCTVRRPLERIMFVAQISEHLEGHHVLYVQPSGTASSSGLSKTPTNRPAFSSPSTSLHLAPCFIATPQTTTFTPSASSSFHADNNVVPLLTASSMSAIRRFPIRSGSWCGSSQRRFLLSSCNGDVMDETGVERLVSYQNLRE